MKRPKYFIWLCLLGTLMLGIALVSACQPATPEPTPTAVPTIEPTPTPIPIPDQSAYIAAWEDGPHSELYDLGKGPNTMCTRCHSPLNWIPGSKAAAPPNCVTCKFATDAELRIAPSFAEGGMDLVTEEQWIGIPCKQCHLVDENGTAGEVAWLVPPEGEAYEEISTPNELCAKCHASPVGAKVSSAGLSASHEIILGGSAHMNYAGEWPQSDRPKYCIDCHDPHNGVPKQCVDCHTNITETHTRVSAMLETVTCMACHDASKAEVGYAKEGGLFTTLLTSPGRGGGPPTVSEIVSHSIVYMVSCNRCHFEGNTWGLTVLTAKGTVPTPAPTP